jgi:ribosome biogenesis GTPase
LVIGEANSLETILVLNKIDLLKETGGDQSKNRTEWTTGLHGLAGLYRKVGYPVLETSAVSGEGLEPLKEVLCAGTSALLGPSGVGKSSLLNAIEPGLGLRTGELSHKKARGRHITVSARMIPLGCGGLVADTPGFSDVGVWGVDQRELESCFPDFHPYREGCQFRGCTHLHEPNCAVQDALQEGWIDAGRFQSYSSLVQEAGGSRRGVT